MPATPAHPFYKKLNEVLDSHGFGDIRAGDRDIGDSGFPVSVPGDK